LQLVKKFLEYTIIIPCARVIKHAFSRENKIDKINYISDSLLGHITS
jgi:hypothetical protein